MTDQKHTKPQTYEDWKAYWDLIREEDRLEALRQYSERSQACVNALAGIADPEAFMRDVRSWKETRSAACDDVSQTTFADLANAESALVGHLKGTDQ